MPSIRPPDIPGPQIEPRAVVVVEPHSDDAFLSLGGHIVEWVNTGVRVAVVTVFSGTRKRAEDAMAYCAAVGAEWHGWGFVEGEPLPPHLPSLPEGRLILPLCLTHPEHFTVRAALDRPGACYYLDQPYAIVQKNGPLASERMAGLEVVSYRKPGLSKYRHSELFKDQQKFFYFNPPEKLVQIAEMILRLPPE